MYFCQFHVYVLNPPCHKIDLLCRRHVTLAQFCIVIIFYAVTFPMKVIHVLKRSVDAEILEVFALNCGAPTSPT